MAKILVVEDKLEEQKLAKNAVEMAGHEAIVVSCAADAIGAMASVDGVITDLHFTPFRSPMEHRHGAQYEQNPPPAGLLIAIAAISMEIPVVICTDADGDHHGPSMGWIFDGFVGRDNGRLLEEIRQERLGLAPVEVDYDQPGDHRPYLPFGWEEFKNWENAVAILVSRMS